MSQFFSQTGEIPKTFKNTLNSNPDVKPHMQRAMFFVGMVETAIPQQGLEAFNNRAVFSEREVLDINRAFICRQLKIEDFTVYSAGDESAPDPGKKRMSSMPGRPSSYFFTTGSS